MAIHDMNSLFASIAAIGQGNSKEGAANMEEALKFVAELIRSISASLEKTTTESARETIEKLELAMTKLFKIALFIRGDYDNRNPDDAQKAALFGQTIDGFQDVVGSSEKGLKTIGDLHAQVMELQSMALTPAKDKIDRMIENNLNELATTRSQIDSTASSITTLQNSLRDQENAIRSIQTKIEDARTASKASDTIFTVIGFLNIPMAIANAVNDGPVDPFKFHEELDNAVRRRDDMQQTLHASSRQLSDLQSKKTALEGQLAAARILEGSLPRLLAERSFTESRSTMLQSRFGTLKEMTANLLLKVKRVEGDATVTNKLAFTKKEFAVNLLEVCKDALIDSRLTDEVQMVRDEIFGEYGAKIPEEVTEAGDEVMVKLGVLSGVPSICSV